jgi:hypothetical protein
MDAFVKPYVLGFVFVRAVLVSGLSDMPVTNKPVKIYVSTDGTNWNLLTSGYTGAFGTVATTYAVENRKTWFRAVFEGDDYYEPSSDTVVWDPPIGPWVGCGAALRLMIEEYTDRIEVIARLVDHNGNPLSNKRIWFRSVVGSAATIFDVKYTDSSGRAVAQYYNKSVPVKFEAVFVGDDQCDWAYAYAEWRSGKYFTYMTLNVNYDSSNNVLMLHADLYDVGGFPIPNKTIYFKVSEDGDTWTEFDSKVTNSVGRATATHPVRSRLFFRAEFRGDDTYTPSEASASWPVLRARPNLILNIV